MNNSLTYQCLQAFKKHGQAGILEILARHGAIVIMTPVKASLVTAIGDALDRVEHKDGPWHCDSILATATGLKCMVMIRQACVQKARQELGIKVDA